MACRLYDLLPSILQYKDKFASGDQSAEGILEKIVYALEQECDTTSSEISNLATLLDADLCDADFLLYLSATLGTMIGSTTVFGVEFQRWFTKNLIAFHKIKGTHLSWDKQFKRLRPDTWSGTPADFWYRAWELWKTIPREYGDYSRQQDYTHLLKAARFDLYYLDGGGSPVYLTPAQAAPLIPYIESIRPIHVLLRRNHRWVRLTDSLSQATDSLTISVVNVEFEDTVPEIEDEQLGTVTCQSTCETACQGLCETACQVICQLTCQSSCTSGVESETPDCGSSCQSSCQVGSCQSGCQSCNETEKFPAHIEGVHSVGAHSGEWIYGRVWLPAPEMTFPPNGELANPWWITPAGAVPEETQRLYFDKVGNGHFAYTGPAGSHAGTLSPPLPPGGSVWMEVRCVKPLEFSEEHAVDGDGVIQTWTGEIGGGGGGDPIQPHPCSVRIEAVTEAAETTIAVEANAGDAELDTANTTGFVPGGIIRIESDDHLEIHRIVGIAGAFIYIGGTLANDFPVGSTVRISETKQVAHTARMLEPTNDTHWWGPFAGDIAPASTSRTNYRGDHDFTVTFREPPLPGATITVYYVKEEDCEYWLEQLFESGGTSDNPKAMLPAIGDIGTETAQVDEWNRNNQPVNQDGFELKITTRPVYDDTSLETLFAFVRTLKVDSLGRVVSLSAETQVTVDVPVDCP